MKKKLSTLFVTLLIVLVMLNILLFPEICIKGAESGLLLWFNKLLPSLLPFIILTNMLFNLGVIFKVSHLIHPITSKLFKISGGSFLTFIMGVIGGYPTGAKLSKQLLDTKSISFLEAQKTFCFANNCGCLFIIGTVGSILLKSPQIGYFLVIIHILSAFTMLLLFRFYTPVEPISSACQVAPYAAQSPNFSVAFTSAVQNAMDTIVYVGGYIIFFSVIISILKSSILIQNATASLSTSLHLSPDFLSSILLGSFEFSNGVALICTTNNFSLQSLSLISAIIAFGGFCVIFQSAHLLQGSNLSLVLYMISKFFQAVIAYIYTMLLYPMFFMYTNQTSTVSFNTSILFLIMVICIIIVIFRLLSFSRKAKLPHLFSKKRYS
ncbi:MAG: hypothetical protein RR618_00375 [Cellulosilyticaceae bacterium]